MRYVDTDSASIWVETAADATVVVHAGGRSWQTRTFAVRGHHYALVECTDLEPGSITPYTVDIDGEQVWPQEGSQFPQSVIATLKPDKPLRMAFGSCRTSVSHDAAGNRVHGVDAMRAYALRMAAGEHGDGPDARHWPDLILFLGDQVYADETTAEMQEFICSRRDIEQPPWTELQDYEEYAHLYRLAWSDPANRWLLSTLPSAMIFDDHDIRDDWNTSLEWRRTMEAKPWWHDRIVGGLSSYWVYQHLGNLSPLEREKDSLWQQIVAAGEHDHELDITEHVDALAEEVDRYPDSYRWSYARDFSDTRLIVLDSRAARVFGEGERSMLDTREMEWFDGQMQGGFRHVLIGTSLPFLLGRGLHYVEAFSEALVDGCWGERAARAGERLRQAVDLEHWAAFQSGFQEVARIAVEVADGERGPAPATVTFLSGDVHHSYVAEVGRESGSRIVQAVCSPIRNPLPRSIRFATAALSYGVAGAVGAFAARSAQMADAPFSWRLVEGPWFENSLATLEASEHCLDLWWETGVVRGDDETRPELTRVATATFDDRRSPPVSTREAIQGSLWTRARSRVRAARSRRAR